MASYHARNALLPSGWHRDVHIEVDDDTGTISDVQANIAPNTCERIDGFVIPGLANVHSHAFQRAMAGLAEGSQGTHPSDTFWTWRTLMYRIVERISPQAMEHIALQLYIELLKGGYTTVCEFHYVHNAPDGRAYTNPAETSERIVAAATGAGIGLTLLPVLYMTSNFGGAPPQEAQRRFIATPERMLDLVGRLRRQHGDLITVGVAPHSLRAVPEGALDELLRGFAALGHGPVHIHVAEQVKEVDDCVAWSGQRPVQWLLEHHGVDARWCLVHATHMTKDETSALARTGAVAGLCPTTEANLGDGFFEFPQYMGQGGAYGIGSDSNVCSRAAQELRLIEYAQRLEHRRRNIASNNTGSTGYALYRSALVGGARAAGYAAQGIEIGARADLVVLEPDHAALAGRPPDAVLDAYIFADHGNPVRDVMARGRWVVRDRRHAREEVALAQYARALRELT